MSKGEQSSEEEESFKYIIKKLMSYDIVRVINRPGYKFIIN